MPIKLANDDTPLNQGARTIIDLLLLQRENDIAIETIFDKMSWSRYGRHPESRELALRFKRDTGLSQLDALLRLLGHYVHRTENTAVIDLFLLQREHGIPIEMIFEKMSWTDQDRQSSSMELAHRFKRETGLNQLITLLKLLGNYAKSP